MSSPERRITHVITTLKSGGAEAMLTKLMKYRDRQRFRHSVISLTPGGVFAQQLRSYGVEVIELDFQLRSPSALSMASLIASLRREAPDLVQTWLYHADLAGLAAARAARVKRVAWNLRCEAIPHENEGTLLRSARWLLSRLSSEVDAILFNSLRGRASHEAVGYRAKKWIYVANGVDTTLFRPDDERRRLSRRKLFLPADRPTVGFVGRFDPIKGHSVFLDALGDLPSFHAVLVGRGNDWKNDALAEMISSRGLDARVTLLGERTDVAEVTAAFDVQALASWSEGFPNVLPDAMAAGVPCVSTDVGEAARILGSTGRVVPPGDAHSLAEAVRYTYDRRSELGAAAKCRAQRLLSMEAATAHYEAIWQALIDGDPIVHSPALEGLAS
jgi:glycosyltransferase involved in cell wall biosynthesis